MLGKQSGQDGGDHAYLDHVGRGSFYGFLASLGEELFRDEDFADLYYPANGRPSVPPSLLATALPSHHASFVEEDGATFLDEHPAG